MNWVPHEDGQRCTRHGETFRRGEVCTRCVVDPGPAVEDDADDQPDPELVALHNEIRSRARKMWRVGADKLDDGATDRDIGAACKAIAESTKLERMALEIHDKLTTKRDLATLIRKYAELIGRDGASH